MVIHLKTKQSKQALNKVHFRIKNRLNIINAGLAAKYFALRIILPVLDVALNSSSSNVTILFKNMPYKMLQSLSFVICFICPVLFL